MKIGPTGDAYATWTNSAGRMSVSRLGYSSGNVLWTTTSNLNGSGGLAVDGSGNAYVFTTVQGTATFGTTTLAAWTSNDSDAVVWKLNANGASVWAGKMGSNGGDGIEGAAVDSNGNVYVAGAWGYGGTNQSQNNNFNPGSGPAVRLTYQGGGGNNHGDIFIAKLAQGKNGAMTLAWAKDIGDNNGGTAYDHGSTALGVAVDGTGNVYTTGRFVGTMNFNSNGGAGHTISPAAAFSFPNSTRRATTSRPRASPARRTGPAITAKATPSPWTVPAMSTRPGSSTARRRTSARPVSTTSIRASAAYSSPS